MARPTRNRSAMITPPSLGTLLSVPSTTIPTPSSPLDDPVILNQLQHGRYDDPQGDRRRYHPLPIRNRPAQALIRGAVRLVNGHAPTAIRFAIPDVVAVCVRRKARREVLHALRRLNKRSGSGGGRRRNRFSGIQC